MNRNHRPLRVLVTGAAGRIGGAVCRWLAEKPERFEVYGLDRPCFLCLGRRTAPLPKNMVRAVNLRRFAALRRAVEGMDTVVHLAADSDPEAAWDSVLKNNIVGTRNLFEACRQAGVRRVVFASSVQVVLGYGDTEPYASLLGGGPDRVVQKTVPPLTHAHPVRPLNCYAASKVFGEALAHVYAQAHGLSCLCLRIGAVQPDEALPLWGDAKVFWCSRKDVCRAVEHCIAAPDSLRFDVFFCQSRNDQRMVDIDHARDVLGWEPEDDALDKRRG